MKLRAHAKLTLSFRVLGRRADGYHDVDGLVASLDGLADDVEVSLRDRPGVALEVTGPASEGVPADESNLAVRAARLVLGERGATIRLHKSIPPGTGLGGGSADAAAVLRGLAALLPGETAGLDLVALGAGLGADVPFCLTGGLARVRGRGEVVEPVEPTTTRWAVIAVPPFRLSTAEVYAAWDDLGGPTGPANDLEPAAIAVEPRLAVFRDALRDVAGRSPVLAGSGSAYSLLLDDEGEAAGVAARVTGARDVWVSPVAG